MCMHVLECYKAGSCVCLCMLGCYSGSLGNHLGRKWAHGVFVCTHVCAWVLQSKDLFFLSSLSLFGDHLSKKNLLFPLK